MFNPPKRITLYKFTNLHFEWMQSFQVKENDSKWVIIICLWPVKHLKKNGMKRRIKSIIVKMSFTNNVFHSSYQERHWKMHLGFCGKTSFLGFLRRNYSFFKHNIWSIIFEDLKWTPILSLIVSKCLKKQFLIVEDHMYIVILLHKWRRTLSNQVVKSLVEI